MDSKESLGYLKGLIDGLNVEDEKQAKIFNAIADVLTDLVYDNEEICENLEYIAEGLDDVYDIIDDDCDCGCDCGCEDEEFPFQCPECGNEIVATWDDIEEGGISCEKCGEYIELEADYEDDEEQQFCD